uniref:hypothetical protein n=1 Tax=Candidatus Pantoea varia TaxID=1881036 RepID=UPI0020C91EEF|nr:hypothetical protein [Pantoea varia]
MGTLSCHVQDGRVLSGLVLCGFAFFFGWLAVPTVPGPAQSHSMLSVQALSAG